jgi:hypothetical protein
MSKQKTRSPKSAAVPVKYAGKWLAWDPEETRILAAERTFAEAKAAAEAVGEKRSVMVKAPLADVRFVVGGKRVRTILHGQSKNARIPRRPDRLIERTFRHAQFNPLALYSALANGSDLFAGQNGYLYECT